MEAALAVCKAWGFAQRQGLIWVKTTADGERVRFGGGHCFRLATEPALVAMRGKYSKHVLSHGEHNVVMAPRQAHSQKPDESYEKIMRVCPGPYLELFARRRYSPAWDVWGNEVNSDLSATFPSGV
jgi:N6-adenosine-specific RNA methylase IME4